jgi:hypothetical protein
MGRSKKNKLLWKFNQNSRSKRKKGKHERFWIEDCPDTELTDDCSARQVVDVLITRVELNDDYQKTSVATETKLESKPKETITKSKGDDKPQAYVEPPSEEGNEQSLNAQKIAKAETSPSPSSGIAATKAEGNQKKDDIAPKKQEAKQKEEEPTPLIMIKRTKSAKGKLRKVSLIFLKHYWQLLGTQYYLCGLVLSVCHELQTIARWRLRRWNYKSIPERRGR